MSVNSCLELDQILHVLKNYVFESKNYKIYFLEGMLKNFIIIIFMNFNNFFLKFNL